MLMMPIYPAGLANHIGPYNFTHEVARVTVPTLVIAANDDVLVPSSSSVDLLRAIRGSQVKQLRDGGHAVNVTRAHEFNRSVVDFVTQTASF